MLPVNVPLLPSKMRTFSKRMVLDGPADCGCANALTSARQSTASRTETARANMSVLQTFYGLEAFREASATAT